MEVKVNLMFKMWVTVNFFKSGAMYNVAASNIFGDFICYKYHRMLQ